MGGVGAPRHLCRRTSSARRRTAACCQCCSRRPPSPCPGRGRGRGERGEAPWGWVNPGDAPSERPSAASGAHLQADGLEGALGEQRLGHLLQVAKVVTETDHILCGGGKGEHRARDVSKYMFNMRDPNFRVYLVKVERGLPVDVEAGQAWKEGGGTRCEAQGR